MRSKTKVRLDLSAIMASVFLVLLLLVWFLYIFYFYLDGKPFVMSVLGY